MKPHEIEEIEIALFLQAIFERYGHDFRHYAKASLHRRIRKIRERASVSTVSELIPRLLHDEEFFAGILEDFSITVSEMFRDPGYFLSLRENVIPYLKTYPFVRFWHAGCSTGEEVYSSAIMLEEEGFYDRVTLFATDFNAHALHQAEAGIYSLEKIRQYTANYQEAGGKRSFSDYYHASYDSAILDQRLRRNITFANHNLVTDGVFSEVHFVSCRNVLIYFDRELQDRVLRLFSDSLVHGGILALGSKESLKFSSIADQFRVVDAKWKIYRKIGE